MYLTEDKVTEMIAQGATAADIAQAITLITFEMMAELAPETMHKVLVGLKGQGLSTSVDIVAGVLLEEEEE